MQVTVVNSPLIGITLSLSNFLLLKKRVYNFALLPRNKHYAKKIDMQCVTNALNHALEWIRCRRKNSLIHAWQQNAKNTAEYKAYKKLQPFLHTTPTLPSNRLILLLDNKANAIRFDPAYYQQHALDSLLLIGYTTQLLVWHTHNAGAGWAWGIGNSNRWVNRGRHTGRAATAWPVYDGF